MADLPDDRTRLRCAHCGNLTRFDIVRTTRTREFWHVDMAGTPTVEEREGLSEVVEATACRWCGPTMTTRHCACGAAGGGGVATAQGAWESHAKGEGPEVGPFNAPGWTEVVDLVHYCKSKATQLSAKGGFCCL